ncbi:MAG: sugar phosphate isomerase/epimerase family protein [Planctomycetota bacterium]|jgi:sugar phosphate isomerase/epimerase
MKTRRQFLSETAAASAALIAGSKAIAAAGASGKEGEWPIAVFEKVFEALGYDELADAMVKIGADGVEATVRPKGHIEPEAAPDELPKMARSMAKRGKRIVIAATHVRRVDEPYTESLLETVKSLGITHYRMGHYYLNPQQPMKQQVAQYAAQARELAALNAEIGLQGLYQNHSGARYLGALAWDAAAMLDGIDPDALGVALDLRHLRTDTGLSWKTAASVLKPHVRSIYVKDAVWTGPRTDQLEDAPLDTGFVTDEIFEFVRKDLQPVPLSIHMEYLGYRVFEKHEIPKAIVAHQNDIKALRRWLEE